PGRAPVPDRRALTSRLLRYTNYSDSENLWNRIISEEAVGVKGTGTKAGGGIRVQGLSKTYRGGVQALEDVSFSVGGGEAFGLLGPNGAGKTTTIGILTTTVKATA